MFFGKPVMTKAPIQPLNVANFVRRVLVPEAASLLIQEDLQISRDQALKVMKESREYGAAMFPESDGSDDEAQQAEKSKARKTVNPKPLFVFKSKRSRSYSDDDSDLEFKDNRKATDTEKNAPKKKRSRR